MEHHFDLSINGNVSFPTKFEPAHSLIVNFSRSSPITEYCLNFTNKDNFSDLSFVFDLDTPINCYFKFVKLNGKVKYVGCQQIKSSEQTINIANFASFSIIISKNKNKDIKTALTLKTISLS